MTPHNQLIKHDPENGMYGDCQRTCIAVILDLHPSEVPHFCEDPTATRHDENWREKRQARWLHDRGLTAATVAYSVGPSSEGTWEVSMLAIGVKP